MKWLLRWSCLRHIAVSARRLLCSLQMALLVGCGQSLLDNEQLDLSSVSPGQAELQHTAIRIGQGYDTLRDMRRAHCLQSFEVIEQMAASGQSVQHRMLLINDKKAGREALHVSAGASLQLGIGSGGGLVDVMNQLNMDQQTTYLILEVKYHNAAKTILKPLLDPNYLQLLLLDKESFREKCGDVFVDVIYTGGLLTAILEIQHDVTESKFHLEAQIQANGVGWKASAEFEQVLQQTLSNRRIQVHMHQVGGQDDEIGFCEDIPCLLQRAKLFGEIVRKHPVVFEMYTNDYTTASSQSLMPTREDIASKEEALDVLAEQYDAWRETLDSFEQARKTPSHHSQEQEKQLQQTLIDAISACSQNLYLLKTQARKCARKFEDCFVPQLHGISALPPKRSQKIYPPYQGEQPLFRKPFVPSYYEIAQVPADVCVSDQLDTVEQAQQRLQWACFCHFIGARDCRQMQMELDEHGHAVLRHQPFYPTFRVLGNFGGIWRPESNGMGGMVVDGLLAAQQEEPAMPMNCFIPANVIWYTSCSLPATAPQHSSASPEQPVMAGKAYADEL